MKAVELNCKFKNMFNGLTKSKGVKEKNLSLLHIKPLHLLGSVGKMSYELIWLT